MKLFCASTIFSLYFVIIGLGSQYVPTPAATGVSRDLASQGGVVMGYTYEASDWERFHLFFSQLKEFDDLPTSHEIRLVGRRGTLPRR